MGWDRGVPLSRTPPHKQDAPLVPVPPLLPRLQCHRGCTCCRAGAQGHGGRGDTTNPPKPSRMGIRGCGPPPKCEKASAGCRGGAPWGCGAPQNAEHRGVADRWMRRWGHGGTRLPPGGSRTSGSGDAQGGGRGPQEYFRGTRGDAIRTRGGGVAETKMRQWGAEGDAVHPPKWGCDTPKAGGAGRGVQAALTPPQGCRQRRQRG